MPHVRFKNQSHPDDFALSWFLLILLDCYPSLLMQASLTPPTHVDSYAAQVPPLGFPVDQAPGVSNPLFKLAHQRGCSMGRKLPRQLSLAYPWPCCCLDPSNPSDCLKHSNRSVDALQVCNGYLPADSALSRLIFVVDFLTNNDFYVVLSNNLEVGLSVHSVILGW